MSTASEEGAHTAAGEAAADAGTADRDDTAIDAGMLRVTETAAAAAEPGVTNDQQLCDVADAVCEPESTNVSSEASNSSQEQVPIDQDTSVAVESASALHLKPFEKGWHREVVYRTVSANVRATSPPSEICYFSPEGTKLRSRTQLVDYLKRTGSELSESCFTFCKQTIYHEPQEKVRYTGHTRGRHAASKSSPHRHRTKMTGRDGATDDSDTLVQRKKAKQSETGPSLLVKRDVDVLSSLASDSRRPKSIMILPDADICEHETAEMLNASDLENTSGDMAEDLCMQRAPGTDTSSVEEREAGDLVASVSNELSVLRYVTSTSDQMHVEDMLVPAADSYHESSREVSSPRSLSSTVVFTSQTITDTASVISQLNSRVTLAELQSMQPSPPVPSHMSHDLKTCFASPSSSTAAVWTSTDGSTRPTSYGPMQISAQVLTLPRSITNCRNLSRPLTLCYAGRQVIVPPSCIVLGAEGAKLLLPPQTIVPNKPLSDPLDLSCNSTITSSSADQSTVGAPASPFKSGSVSETAPSGQTESLLPVSTSPSKSGSALETASRDKMESLSPELTEHKDEPFVDQCPIGTVSSSDEPQSPSEPHYLAESADQQVLSDNEEKDNSDQSTTLDIGKLSDRSLVHIFTFLPPMDLLRVRRVCTRWNALTNDSMLWRTVTLDHHVCVTDWHQAARFLSGRQVQQLALTSLADVSAYEFRDLFTQLTYLTSLRIGYCDTWTSETYAELASLVNLHHLTLECSQHQLTLSAISPLTRLESLTLKRFVVTEALELNKMSWLKYLHIDDFVADQSAAAATTLCDVASTLSVVCHLTFLHCLVWTFNSETIPLSRHILTDEDKKQMAPSEDETVTIRDLQVYLQRCIPQADVQLKLCRL